MSDNIDDFFRKKLDDFSDSSDNWDQPNSKIWASVQTQSLLSNNLPVNKILLLMAALLGIGLLGSIIYINQLHNKNTALKITTQTLNHQLHQKNQDFSTLQATCTSALQTNQTQQIAATTLIENLKTTILSDKKIIQQQQQEIQQLYKRQQQFEEKLNMLKTANLAQLSVPKDTVLFANQKHTILKKHSLITLEKLPSTNIERHDSLNFVRVDKPQPLPTPATWKKFEIGTTSSILTYIIPVSNDIENTSSIQSESQNEKEYSEVSGIYFAYAPKPNLYFRTGIQASYFDFERSSIAGLIYDKSSEYTNTEGNLANDFSLKSSTAFNEIEQEISVEIPQGTTLETGDLLIMTLTNYQNFEFFQIPLGVAYYRGQNKWQWEFQSGLLLNRLSIGNYQIQANFQANNIEIPIDGINIIDQTEIVKHFISGYLGVGGNYQVTPNWQFRLGVRLEDNTFDIRSSNFLRFKNFNMGLNVNVNYRF